MLQQQIVHKYCKESYLSTTIQIKAIRQSFDISCLQYNATLTFQSVEKPLVNAIAGTVLPGVLFIMLYKLIFTFKSVDKTPVCDHSNESY